MAGVRGQVKVSGLADLRRDLQDMGDRAVLRALRAGLRGAAEPVADRAREIAPRLTGALASSIRPGTKGPRAVVYSALPYAGWIHFGGEIKPRGVPIRASGRPFVYEAMADEYDRMVDRVDGELTAALVAHGFK